MCFYYSFGLITRIWECISTYSSGVNGKNVFHVMEFYRDTLSGTYPFWNAGTHHSCLLHFRDLEQLKVLDTVEYLFVLQVSSLRIQWRRKLLTSGTRYLSQFRKYTPRNFMITLWGTCSNTAPWLWVHKTSKIERPFWWSDLTTVMGEWWERT